MPGFLTVTEPHPTVKANTYIHSGRGGSGNYFKAPEKITPASGVPTTVTAAPVRPQTQKRFLSGRGGAGNVHDSDKRPAISFDELYRVQSHIEETPVRMTGRGGAGNVVAQKPKDSDACSRHSGSTTSSSSSTRSNFMQRLSSFASRNGR